ncbi:MAG: energy transducer TonB [Bacteroidales bacterium]
MTLDKLFNCADRIVQRYFLPISITLLIHLMIFGILIVLEMAKPEKQSQSEIIIDFENEEIALPELQSNKVEKPELTDNQSQEVKNVEKNLGESNKSFQDYYREAKELLEKGKPKENFKANDYNDQRWLVKDYSKEIPDVENWDKPNSSKNNNETNNSNNTYAGNAIISYDLGGRRAIRLPIPAYKCQGFGKVTIEIIVNQKGNVISARIISVDASLNESCLPNTALESARSSRFVPDDKAPSNQKGFIYYTFVAQ